MSKEQETISVEGPVDLYDGIVTAPPALVVVYGGNLGKAYYLQQAEAIVGRDLSADIHLDEDSVSRRHARITVTTRRRGSAISNRPTGCLSMATVYSTPY
jgi:hypothetical protein